jgi:hypothetical protein
VNVDIQQLETSVWHQARTSGNYNSMITAWTNDMNDPTEIVNYEMRGGEGSGSFAYWTRYNSPDLNAKITAADLEQDPARREAEYVDIQRSFLHDAPLVFIANLGATAGWRDNVNGFLIDGLSYYRFEDVTLSRYDHTLSYLGLGPQPPTPEWGAMIAAGRQFLLQAWWITALPGFALLLLGVALSLIGDGLADRR